WSLVDLLRAEPTIGSIQAACRFLARVGGVPKLGLGTPKREGQRRIVREPEQIRSLYKRADRLLRANVDFEIQARFHQRLIQNRAASYGGTVAEWARWRAKTNWS